MRRSRLAAAMLGAFVLAACSGSSGSARTPATVRGLDGLALEFAVSAERALQGTAFEVVSSEAVADLVVGLCKGLGVGAVPATVDGLGIEAQPGDQEILAEILTSGMVQVCGDRAPVDLTGFYLDAVRGAVESSGGVAAFEEDDAIRAGPVVCATLESGLGVEAALLATVASLFGVVVGGADQLADVLDGDQGLVAGAVFASATALICPEFAGAVEAFVESL